MAYTSDRTKKPSTGLLSGARQKVKELEQQTVEQQAQVQKQKADLLKPEPKPKGLIGSTVEKLGQDLYQANKYAAIQNRKMDDIEKNKTALVDVGKSKYGLDISKMGNPNELEVGGFKEVKALKNLSEKERDELTKLRARYQVLEDAQHPFREGFQDALSFGASTGKGSRYFYDKYGTDTSELDLSQRSKKFKYGEIGGSLAKNAALYATLGPVVGKAIGPTVGKTLGTGAFGQFGTELAKDIVIGGGTGVVESLARGTDVEEDLVSNIKRDVIFNVLLGVGGKLAGFGIDALKKAKTVDKVEEVAKQLDVTPQQANKIIDDTIAKESAKSTDIQTEIKPEYQTSQSPLKAVREQLNTRSMAENTGIDSGVSTSAMIEQPIKKVKEKQNFRRTLTNSFQKSQLDDEAKLYFDANPREYEVYTNPESWDKAFDKVSSNVDEYKKVFDSKTSLESADDTAEGIALMNRLSASKDLDGLYDVADKFAERATNAGRAVQAIVMLQKTTPEGKLVQGFNAIKNANKKLLEETPDLYNKLKKNGKLPEITKEDAEFIVNTMKKAEGLEGDLKRLEIAKVDQLLADKIPATFGDKARALRNLSLLGNFKTIGTRNPLGNVIFSGLENLSQIPSGLTDKIVSAALKTNRTTQVLPDLLEQGRGFKKGVSDALSDIKLGIDTSPARGGAELPRSRKIFEISLLNKANNWLGDALKLGDRPFYEAAYQSRLKELKKFMPDADPKELEKLASEFGLSRTFQNEGATSQAFKKFKSVLNTANIKGFGLGDVIMPYTQTPANILAKGVQYTPLNIIQIAKIASGGTGNIAKNQKAFVDAVGRTFTGTGAIALGYALAKNGYISGKNNDKSDKVRELKKDVGTQQYSIKIGDTWYSYDWAQPASIPLAIGVDFYNAGASEQDLMSAIEKGLVSGGQTLLEQGLLQNVTRMFGGYSPVENLIETVVTSPTQFTPTLGSQTAQFLDPFKRDVDYNSSASKQLVDSLKRRIPGFRETLPETLNLWGEPVKEQQGRTGVEKAFDVFVNPALKSTETQDPITKEVYKVFQDSKETGVIPSYTPQALTTTEDIRNFKLIYGPMAKTRLQSLFASQEYKSSKEKHKLIKKVLNGLQDDAKEKYNDKYGTELK